MVRAAALRRINTAVLLLLLGAGCAARTSRPDIVTTSAARNDALARARVWTETPTASLDVRRGPRGDGAFAPGALVECTRVDRDMSGSTPKFTCRLPGGRDVKVKYGRDNGEVYAEVAASRILWALGFTADAMYPVRVRCHGCEGGTPDGDARLFDPATIERKVRGRTLADDGGEGWSWPELDTLAPTGALSTRAQRDALKLLAAMLQHTDSKREQQQLVCEADSWSTSGCRRPIAYISDLGKTFGKVNLMNRDTPGSVNLDAWLEAPVWNGTTGCRANAGMTFTGTLKDPEISEEGRQLLARLLQRLSDAQLRDVFDVARFPVRAAATGHESETVERWVAAFRKKAAEIASRRCDVTRAER
ncbi:hypothetical protein [Luteitalea pratensis]|uniref:hypothetical protein n=1 Tax=Luteitalea pratensis TaxID=1855912 RepID=UPI0012FFC2E5|nr:hypothetical protein [Luteitalea pratensis]